MDSRFKKCKELLLGEKNVEYSRNGDKLHNFKVAAKMRNTTPENALIGMWVKQLVSIFDIVNDLKGEELPKRETLAEKITDSINYLILLEALITERAEDDPFD